MAPIVNAESPAPDAGVAGPAEMRGERDEAPNEETRPGRAAAHAPGRLLRAARRWAEQDRVAEALPLAEHAARLYRGLARADPELYLPDLLCALTEVGTLRSYMGWESAVAPAQEATLIYRQLTTARVVVVPEVVGSLSDLLVFLWERAADASRLHGSDSESMGNSESMGTCSGR